MGIAMKARVIGVLFAVVLICACSSAEDPTPSPVPETNIVSPVAPTESTNVTLPATPVAAPPSISSDDVQVDIPPDSVHMELPAWVQESPGLALALIYADTIIEARLASIESEVKAHESYGHVAELSYKFNVLQYLKGEGDDELSVQLSSGPKYHAFPDVIDRRSEEEAEDLAEKWLSGQRSARGRDRNVILLLTGGKEKTYTFLYTKRNADRDVSPYLGKSWIAIDDDSLPLTLRFPGSVLSPVTILDLKTRIREMDELTATEFGNCIRLALGYRSLVRDQHLGIYRELTVAGWREPDPFPQYNSMENQQHSSVFAYRLERPPLVSNRFSDYWLDGKDKHLFEIRVRADPNNSERPAYYLEVVSSKGPLPAGEYSIIFAQYHHQLPCTSTYFKEQWSSHDVVELIVTIDNEEETLYEGSVALEELDSGVGADSFRGLITPNSFSLDATTNVTINEIFWDSGEFILRINIDGPTMPTGAVYLNGNYGSWETLHFANASLAVEDGETTLRWGLCDWEWSGGDLLLLRVQEKTQYDWDTSEEECLASRDP